MHKATTPSNAEDGGLFSRKGSIFGGASRSARPSTGKASTGTYGSYGDSIVSQDSIALYNPSGLPRKASFSFASNSPQSAYKSRRPSTGAPNFAYSPERRADTVGSKSKPSISVKTQVRNETAPRPSADAFTPFPLQAHSSDRDSFTSTTPYSDMLATSLTRDLRPGASYQGGGFNAATSTMMATMPAPQSPTLETITYQHIQDMASKRISTLGYLRKAHEGRVYWFNTLLFNKPDLARMPYFDARKLARRATNYLLLGLSLPTVLDLNSSTSNDFLRTLNALLAEFEAFQQIHPPDGSSSSSLSRARLPQMFKRATTTGGRGRRTSSAADIGLPMSSDAHDLKSVTGSISSVASASVISLPPSDNDLLPGEEYTYLLTPSLPFDPDFYETFATLCDVLIDCYTRLMSLVASPKDCGPHIAEMFTKADARIRKIIVQGVVKEFEDTSRSGVKSEVAGVGKVVLGGLM